MIIINADRLQDGLYNIKNGKIFKYKAKGGTVRTYEMGEIVRCKDCYHAEDDITHMFCVYFGHKVYGDDYCSNAVERREDGEA
jgi:hypothetical protein